MIADLDRTIEQILAAEIPIKNGEIDVKFDQPKREWSARLARPTINFFLYDVRENNVLRQHRWQSVTNGNGRPNEHLTMLKRAPFRFDLNYIITTWAAEPQDEHLLLTRCMLALLRYPLLPREHFVGEIKEQPFDIQARLGNHDKLTNPAEVWGSLDNELRPSISYVVTLALDPWTVVSHPVTQTFTFRTGQVQNGGRITSETSEELLTIRGVVTRENKPQSGIEVAIKGTGFVSATDDKGQFHFGSLQPGEYTLVAWTADGKPQQRPISVPAPAPDGYDIKL